MRIAIVVKESSGPAERAIMNHIYRGLADVGNEVMFASDRNWRTAIRNCEIAIVHSPFVFSLVQVAFAKLLGKPVVVMVWDSYPVIIDGRRYDQRLKRRIADAIEIATLKLADLLIVPSRDFLEAPYLNNALHVPIWAPPTSLSIKPDRKRDDASPEWRILFAGQVNDTRGIGNALQELSRLLPDPFELLIASHDLLGKSLLADARVTFLGSQSKEDLKRIATTCDFGLVSLAPGFEGPGFPSKTFDYLGAGLPCLYAGPPLSHYLSLLESSRAGIDLGSRTGQLDREELRELQAGIGSARDRFLEMTVLDANALDSALEKLVRKND